MSNAAHLRIEESPASERASRALKKSAKPGLRSLPPWELPAVEPRTAARKPRLERPQDGRTSDGTPERRDRVDHRSALLTYLRDLRRHPLMTREEEHRVAVAYVETGDKRLGNQLVTANLRLVVKIALEYRTSHRNLLDLVQEGNVGLLQAVQKYDPRRGVKLATYAAWWIRAYILKFILSNARLVKLGTTQAQRRLFFGLRRERARLEGRDGEAVEARQLAATFDVSEKEVVDMERRLSTSEASLDAPTRREDGEGPARGDIVAADEGMRPDLQVETSELRAALSREIGVFRQTLTGRDVEIFEGRLASEEGTTLAEIAVRFGVSRERVRQLEERLKLRLARHLTATLGDAVPALAVRATA
jgi:RNA polymerase sigma-32 factor